MRLILEKMLKEMEFDKKEIECDNKYDFDVYVNKIDETYVLLYNENLNNKLLDKVIKISHKIFKSKSISRAQKSNLYLILITNINRKLSESEKNIILQIEENTLYYQKLVFWYEENELEELKKMINEKDVVESLYNYLIDGNKFKEYKDSYKQKDKDSDKQTEAYSLISRIYIKFPCMTLQDIEPINKSLLEYIKEQLYNIDKNLFSMLTESDEDIILDKVLDTVQLTEADEKEIEKELSEVGAVYER